MFKKAIVLIVIAIGQISLASYPYFNFDYKNLKLHRDSYYRYIRPQLRNIKSEFYHISRKVAPAHQYLIQLRERSLELKLSYNKVFEKCKKQQKEQAYCDADTSALLNITYKLDKALMSARLKVLSSDYIDEKNFSSYILFSKNVDEIEILNTRIQRYLELKNIVDKTLYITYTQSFTDLSNTISRLFSLANFAYIDMLPSDQQSYFESLLIHFITPLEERMIKNYSPEWFKQELGKLNLTWNTFHMNLEKGQSSFPKKHIKTVKIMHNRWNSILKIIF